MDLVLRIVMLLLVVVEAKKKGKKEPYTTAITFERFGDCEGMSNNDARVLWYEIKDLGKGVTNFGVDILTGKHPPPRLKALVTLYRCKTMEDPNCEQHLNFKLDYCNLLLEKNQFYSAFLTFEPPMRCPIGSRKIHRVRNATFDNKKLITFLGTLPRDAFGNHWKIRFLIADSKSLHTEMCLYLLLKLSQIRSIISVY